MNHLFPIYLKLDQLQTLVVGGGPVGLEKLQALIANSPNAVIKVVAKDVCIALLEFIDGKKNIQLEVREFVEEDLWDKQIVILATNNPTFNDYVRELTAENNILLNVADKPALCDFYLGSVVQKGDLKIGISTNGKSPTIAKRIKELLEDLLPEEIDETLELMSSYRRQLKGDLKAKIEVLNAHTESLIR
ncbi:precorrin-2 dehydrogenase/sirohydrochlorin ferrochelatase family protein [Sphingobacterium kyonggiense]